jgi:hypothetical protein
VWRTIAAKANGNQEKARQGWHICVKSEDPFTGKILATTYFAWQTAKGVD